MDDNQLSAEEELDHMLDMIRWAYSKLHRSNFPTQDDALMLDRMKLLLEHGIIA